MVVPPGPTAATLRRLLPRVSGGVAGIRFLTPIDLAVELVDSSVSTKRAVTTQLQLAAVTSVLAGDQCPALLRDVRDHPATIAALVEMAMALRAAHVVPGALEALAGDPTSVRAALIEVVVRARQRLVAVDVRDESATLAALDAVDESTLATLRAVLVVTDTFHPAQVPFLQRLAGQPACRVIASPPAPGDTALASQLRSLGGEDPPVLVTFTPSVVSCPDPDEEVRHVVRECARLIDEGVPADDIAIVCASVTHRRPVRDELQRGGIAWSGGAVERLRGSVAGQVLRHVLDGVIGGWDRPSVFRLLSVAPLYATGELVDVAVPPARPRHRRRLEPRRGGTRQRRPCPPATVVGRPDRCTGHPSRARRQGSTRPVALARRAPAHPVATLATCIHVGRGVEGVGCADVGPHRRLVVARASLGRWPCVATKCGRSRRTNRHRFGRARSRRCRRALRDGIDASDRRHPARCARSPAG